MKNVNIHLILMKCLQDQYKYIDSNSEIIEVYLKSISILFSKCIILKVSILDIVQWPDCILNYGNYLTKLNKINTNI